MIRKFLLKLLNAGCEHHHQAVVDKTDSGQFVIACPECRTAWIVPVRAEGISLTITKAGMSRGCATCRQYVFEKIEKESPEDFDYKCGRCEEHWELHRSKPA